MGLTILDCIQGGLKKTQDKFNDLSGRCFLKWEKVSEEIEIKQL